MAQKLAAGIPSALDLEQSWRIQFAAVDPTSGAAVSGVKISNAAIICTQVGPTGGDAALLNEAPLWVAIPLGDQ